MPFLNKWFESNWENAYKEGTSKKKFVYKYLTFISDGWHFLKVAMIYCFIMAVLTFPTSIICIWHIIFFGFIWFFIFEIFYGWIFTNKCWNK